MTLNAYPVPGTIFLSDFNILSSFLKRPSSVWLLQTQQCPGCYSSCYTSWICSSYELVFFSIPLIFKLSLHQNKFRKLLKHASAWTLYQSSQGRPPCQDAGMLYLTSCPDDSMWSWVWDPLSCISGAQTWVQSHEEGPFCIFWGFRSRNLDLPDLGTGSVSFLKLFLAQVVCEATLRNCSWTNLE